MSEDRAEYRVQRQMDAFEADYHAEALSELVAKITPETRHPEIGLSPAPQPPRRRGLLDRLADGFSAALKR